MHPVDPMNQARESTPPSMEVANTLIPGTVQGLAMPETSYPVGNTSQSTQEGSRNEALSLTVINAHTVHPSNLEPDIEVLTPIQAQAVNLNIVIQNLEKSLSQKNLNIDQIDEYIEKVKDLNTQLENQFLNIEENLNWSSYHELKYKLEEIQKELEDRKKYIEERVQLSACPLLKKQIYYTANAFGTSVLLINKNGFIFFIGLMSILLMATNIKKDLRASKLSEHNERLKKKLAVISTSSTGTVGGVVLTLIIFKDFEKMLIDTMSGEDDSDIAIEKKVIIGSIINLYIGCCCAPLLVCLCLKKENRINPEESRNNPGESRVNPNV